MNLEKLAGCLIIDDGKILLDQKTLCFTTHFSVWFVWVFRFPKNPLQTNHYLKIVDFFRIKEKKDCYWKIPSGKIKEGESGRECAIRETKEEANIDVQITGYFGDYRFNFKNRQFELEVYRARIIKGIPCVKESHLEGVDWLPIDSLNDENTTPSNKLIYKDLVGVGI